MGVLNRFLGLFRTSHDDTQNKAEKKAGKPAAAPSPKKNGSNELIVALRAISEVVGEEEVRAARKQRNELGKDHIFDVLKERGKINYYEIAETVYHAFAETIDDLHLARSMNDIEILEDRSVVMKSTKEEVLPVFLPVKNSGKPQVVLPKNEFLQVNRYIHRRDSGDTVNEELKFSFYQVMEHAKKEKASDVHFKYSGNYYHVHFRISGMLVKKPEYIMDKELGNAFIRAVKGEASEWTKGKFNAGEHNIPQDAKIEYPDLHLDLRLAFTPRGMQDDVNILVVRLLEKNLLDRTNVSLKKDGFGEDIIKIAEQTRYMRGGMIVVNGITGSGKSTFVSRLISMIPEWKCGYTFEDPIEIEYNMPNISQHQLFRPDNDTIAVDYLDYIKSIKRGDPDNVFVGEMRNEKDLVRAIAESSAAGQLVYTTTHINSCFSIYSDLEEIFDMKRSISISNVLVSINLVLVRTICPHCRIRDEKLVNQRRLLRELKRGNVRYAYTDDLKKFISEKEVTWIRNENGCEECAHTGYGTDRMPVYEYIKPDVSFVRWLRKQTELDPYEIEERACRTMLGDIPMAKNKLSRYITLIKEGKVDTSSIIMHEVLA